MRVLAVSHTPVWPARSGSAIRRLMGLKALASFGTVDLLYTGEVRSWISQAPPDAELGSVWESPVERVRPSALERARWLLSPRVPFQVIEWANPGAPELPGEPYDVIWYFRAVAYALARGLRGRARVIDFDDLEDNKLRLSGLAGSRHGSMRRRLAERRNTVAWTRYQNRLAAEVDAVAVCSEADRRLLAVQNCYVIPNGFPRVEVTGHTEADPPTVLLVGLFEYEPNADGAEFFVNEVFPSIRRAIPECRVRLVGRDSPRVRKLSGEGIVIAGEVPDLAHEYQCASVAIAPVRFGSGTRVKILEAFARRVPVVSTTLGAAGLNAGHGEEILLADDAASFADACVSLIRGAELGRKLAENAFALYERRFGQSAVTQSVGTVLNALGHGVTAAGWAGADGRSGGTS